MKILVITNDCDGATIETMKQAKEIFSKEYTIPFSESCWVYADEGVSLLGLKDWNVFKKSEFDFLKQLILGGHIDTLHTWGDFPYGGFTRRLVLEASEILKSENIRFFAWTAHGGVDDRQNLLPLGEGDKKGSPFYHLDYTKSLGINFFSRNVDIDVKRPRYFLNYPYFRRFRGLTKEDVSVITLNFLEKQLELAEKVNIWHSLQDVVIIYTHFYAKPSVDGWSSVEEFKVSDKIDSVLRKLAERRDKGNLKILTLKSLLNSIEVDLISSRLQLEKITDLQLRGF